MTVAVKRYQRNKRLGDTSSPLMYYLKREAGNTRTVTIDTMAKEIEALGALSAEDVKHTLQSFIRLMKTKLTQGDKVKVDGLGTFYITFSTEGAEAEKDCTVKSIRRVHIRFAVDNTLRLANDSTATTRGGENNVTFYIKGEAAASGGDNDGGGGDIIDPTA